MAEGVLCPNCKFEITSKNRLIVENCGHSKCRQCLISEENGCEKCKQKNEPPNTENPHFREKINIIEDKFLVSHFTSIQHPEKHPKQTGRTRFPPHIVRQFVDNNVVYFCTICDKRFKSRTQQYYHLFCNNSSKKPYKCEQCFKTFSTSSHLKYHMDGHSQKSFACSVCSKTFSKVQILRQHEKLHTTIAQQCSECGVKLRNQLAFTAHMQKHNNILPYSCNVCEKKFSLKSTLRLHTAVHSGIKPYKCDQCDKKFDRNSTLKLHKLRHSKQKKYSCSKCLKQFIDEKSLMRHNRIHIGNLKYKCTFCDTISIRKDNITRHLKNMHPNEDKNSIEVIKQDLNDMTDQECIDDTPAPKVSSCLGQVHSSEVPKTVANSSVIRWVGNVQPMIIPQEKQALNMAYSQIPPANHPAATTHKKIKKKYDPNEIYRKILLDDDSTQENDTNSIDDTNNEVADQTKQVQESSTFYNGQQSNFSETHWRKNFKYTYQIQFD